MLTYGGPIHNPCEEFSVSPTTTRPLPAVATLALAAVLALGAAGCQGGEDPPDARVGLTPSSAPPVVQPGGPGDDASTLAPGATAEQAEEAHDDVAFMQMMIPHHAQALTMSQLAPRRARSPEVR